MMQFSNHIQKCIELIKSRLAILSVRVHQSIAVGPVVCLLHYFSLFVGFDGHASKRVIPLLEAGVVPAFLNRWSTSTVVDRK